MRRYILLGAIVLLVGATYFTNFFISKQRSFNENIRLKQENENLKAQIQNLPLQKISSSSIIAAYVFSTYPFNIKNEITINAGANQDIKKNDIVLVGENILLGQVMNVFLNYSIVETIFDQSFQLPVRIGNDQVDALFQGGNEPKATLIEKAKPVQTGDIVYSASQQFPYGLKIGEIAQINESSAGVFKEAALKMPFNMNELQQVNILR